VIASIPRPAWDELPDKRRAWAIQVSGAAPFPSPACAFQSASFLVHVFFGRDSGPLLLPRRSPVQLLAAVGPISRVNQQGLIIAEQASGRGNLHSNGSLPASGPESPSVHGPAPRAVGIKPTALVLEEGDRTRTSGGVVAVFSGTLSPKHKQVSDSFSLSVSRSLSLCLNQTKEVSAVMMSRKKKKASWEKAV
jgi:hypothetical protein